MPARQPYNVVDFIPQSVAEFIDTVRELKPALQWGLKVLSSEMDPAEIRLILQIFIKGRGAAAFQKNSHGPHCVKTL